MTSQLRGGLIAIPGYAPMQRGNDAILQRIRDESRRFAVSYHTVLKRQKQDRQ